MLSKLDEKLDKAFGKKVQKEDLHPPMAPPKPIERSPTPEMKAIALERVSSVEIDLESMPKEYWDYCNKNDAKRAWILARFGKLHRGSTADLKRKVIQQNKALEIGKEVVSLVRGSKADYRMVMKELKEKLQEVREKND